MAHVVAHRAALLVYQDPDLVGEHLARRQGFPLVGAFPQGRRRVAHRISRGWLALQKRCLRRGRGGRDCRFRYGRRNGWFGCRLRNGFGAG